MRDLLYPGAVLTRGTLLALLLVSAALAAVVYGVARTMRRDRAVLLQRFGAEQLVQVQQVAKEIQVEFEDVGEDLRFTGQLVQGTTSREERRRTLRALLTVVRPYRLVAVFDARGRPVESVVEPGAGPSFKAERFDNVLRETSQRALRRAPGEIETSPIIETDPTGWLRAFATPLPASSGEAGAIAVLVDTAPFFGKLKLISSEQGARQIVLGSHGRPIPATDRDLIEAVKREAEYPALAELLSQMRAGSQGISHLSDREAEALGLGAAEVVAARAPIPLVGGGHWSLASLSSTLALRSQERAMMVRLAFVSAAVTLCLLGFAGYAVVTSRRAVAISERLRHTEQIAQLTSQLLQAEKLATVGVLAAGIAHEIGTPLGIVRARAERISLKLGPEHGQTSATLVIVEQIDRITRTVRQLLDFSRAQRAAVTSVPISAVAREVDRRAAGRRGLRHRARLQRRRSDRRCPRRRA
jgi:two-component system sensor histidine kinase HydH